jgi:hypothetical protein
MQARLNNISRRRVNPWLKQQPETYSNVTTEPNLNAESQPANRDKLVADLVSRSNLSATDLNVRLLHLCLVGARAGGTSQNLDWLLRDALTQSTKVVPDSPAPILENRTIAETTQPLTEEALEEHNRTFTSFTGRNSDGILPHSDGLTSSASRYLVPYSEVRATCSKSMDTLSIPTGRTRTLPRRDYIISLGSRSTTDSEAWSDPDIDRTQLIDITGTGALGSATIPPHGQSALQNLYDLLDGGAELSDDVETLHTELRALRTEVEHLRKADLPGNGTEVWPTLHTVTCQDFSTPSTFLEPPSYTWEKQHDHLHGHRVVQPKSWEFRHPEKPFTVYLEYDCLLSKKKKRQEQNSAASTLSSTALGDNSIPTTHEYVHINSASLLESLKKFFSTSPLLEAYWAGGVVDNNQTLHTPYYFFYHVGDQLKAYNSSLGDSTLEAELATFIEYLSAQSVHIGDVVAKSIYSRQIYLKHLPFLFAPGTLLVTESDGIHTVVRQESAVNVQITSRESKSRPSLESSDDISDACCSLEASEIRFDGRFWAKTKPLQIRVSSIRNQLITFNELDHLPLELAPAAVRTQLIQRGRKFFDCRSSLYVTCNANVNEVGMGDCVRYMVDADAYRIVHESGDRVQHPIDRREGTEELLPGDDPEDPFLLQLPPRIQGFNMQDKTWVSLLTAGIEPVVWDKAAFENLAIEKDTKELIQALIRNKIKSDQSIDFVKGKGTGLIVLLHGGPGTGKTLTAETVAEIAEKPLYRITCGAMGTTATEVEKNLESVFHLGRRWGCVVLLDEADVFLEQRSLSDLARNALVSVFLRVIEYFDGIMILTSNRVATFDEAFKSRIQLALHYQALDEGQRRQVWQSFVRNLESVDEPVAIDDIKSRIVELSKYSMNGRQIRNVINTARQLARFKEEPLDFEHLKRVIKVSGRFDEYVRGVNEVKDDEQWARENFIR